MKWLVLLSLFGAVLGANAQSTNDVSLGKETPKAPAPVMGTLTNFVFRLGTPNESVKGKLVLNGSVVEIAKTRQPLQLLNPFAPPQYGSPEDHIVRDPINGRVTGLKLFSLSF
jgi:hypothetical protein